MKKSLLTVGAACIAAASMMTGCGGNKAAAKDELQEFIVGSRAAEVIEKTNDKGIDAIASSSTIIYKRVGGAMRDYILKTRGDMATIVLCRQIRNMDTSDAEGIQKAQNLLSGKDSPLTDEEKKDWTPEKLYNAAKEVLAWEYFKYHKGDAPETVSQRTELEQKKYALGEKVHREKLAKEDWNAKIAEMENLLKDLGQITQNTAVLAQDIAQKITAKSSDIATLAQDPAMQNFLKETATLEAKKTFASDEARKELDKQIAAIAQNPAYKPIMDKKAQYEAELIKLKKDSAVLTDGIGKQCKYTGKAIPWLIEEYTSASQL